MTWLAIWHMIQAYRLTKEPPLEEVRLQRQRPGLDGPVQQGVGSRVNRHQPRYDAVELSGSIALQVPLSGQQLGAHRLLELFAEPPRQAAETKNAAAHANRAMAQVPRIARPESFQRLTYLR